VARSERRAIRAERSHHLSDHVRFAPEPVHLLGRHGSVEGNAALTVARPDDVTEGLHSSGFENHLLAFVRKIGRRHPNPAA
jgi:hypothetical protein